MGPPWLAKFFCFVFCVFCLFFYVSCENDLSIVVNKVNVLYSNLNVEGDENVSNVPDIYSNGSGYEYDWNNPMTCFWSSLRFNWNYQFEIFEVSPLRTDFSCVYGGLLHKKFRIDWYRDSLGDLMDLHESSYGCKNTSKVGLRRDYENITDYCFQLDFPSNNFVRFDYGNITYLLDNGPNSIAQQLLDLTFGGLVKLFKYYFFNNYAYHFVRLQFNKFLIWAKKIDIDLVPYVRSLGTYVELFRSKWFRKSIERYARYITVVLSGVDAFCCSIPSASVYIFYIMFIYLIDLIYWFSNRDSGIQMAFTSSLLFVTFTVVGFVIMLKQLFNLHYKIKQIGSYIKNKSVWAWFGVKFVSWIFNMAGNFFFVKLISEFYKMDLLNTTEQFVVSKLELLGWVNYICSWCMVLGAIYVFYLAVSMLNYYLRQFGRFYYAPEYNVYPARVANFIFMDVSIWDFLGKMFQVGFFVGTVWVVVLLTSYLERNDGYEALVWLFHVSYNFLYVWTTFCVVQFILGAAFSIFTTNFFLQGIEDNSNQISFLLQFLIQLYFLYFVDIIKRVILCIFFVPFIFFLIVNYTVYMCTFSGLLLIIAIVNLWLYQFATNGIIQFTQPKRSLVKRAYQITVHVDGVDPAIIGQFNNSLAVSFPKFLCDSLQLRNKLESDQSALVSNINTKFQELRNDILKFNSKMMLDTDKHDSAMISGFYTKMADICSQNTLHRLDQQIKIFLEKKKIEGEHFAEANENINQQELQAAMADIFAFAFEEHYNPELVVARLNDIARIFEPERLNLPIEVPVADMFRHIRIQFREPDWDAIVNRVPNLQELRSVTMSSIWAYSEHDACVDMQRRKYREIPHRYSYQGNSIQAPAPRTPGIWEWKEISVPSDIIVKETVPFMNIAHILYSFLSGFLSLFCNEIELYRDLFLNGKVALTKSMIDLLYQNNVFPDLEIDNLRDLVFNQRVDLVNGNDLEFIQLVNQVSKGLSPRDKDSYVIDFKTVFSNLVGKKIKLNKGQFQFKDYSVPLDIVLDVAKLGNMPSTMPNGLALVSYLGKPHVIFKKHLKLFGRICEEMSPVRNAVVCLDTSARQGHVIYGHLYQETCKDGICGAIARGNIDYGFATRGFKPFFVGNRVRDVAYNDPSKSRIMYNRNPVSIPIRSLFGITYKNRIIGNGAALKCNGISCIVTAAHVLAERGDGLNLGTSSWSSQAVTEVKQEILSAMKTRHMCNILNFNNFLIPQFCSVIDIFGRSIKCQVKNYDRDLVYLTPLEAFPLEGLDVLSSEDSFHPESIYVVEDGKPVLVPIITIDNSNQVVYDYRAKAGYSGAIMVSNNKAHAIHLGGTSDGKGMAYARLSKMGEVLDHTTEVLSMCDDCSGLHYGKCLNQDISSVDDDEIEYNTRLPFDKMSCERITCSDVSGKILAKIEDPITNGVRYKQYSYEDFINNGLKDLNNPLKKQEFVFVGNLSTYVADVLEDKEKVLKDVQIALENRIVNQIAPIEEGLYKSLADNIGEGYLVKLLNKSLLELKNMYSDFLDTNRVLKEKKQVLSNLKIDYESSYDYQQMMKKYREELSDYMKKKKVVDMENAEILKLRSDIRSQREKIEKEYADKINGIVESQKNLGSKQLELTGDYQKKSKLILGKIENINNRLKQAKRSGVTEVEKQLKQDLIALDDEVAELKRKRNNIQNALQKELVHSKDFGNKLEKEVEKLRKDLSDIKRDFQEKKNKLDGEVKSLKEKKKGITLEKSDKMPEMPQLVKIDSAKPQIPKIQFMELITEALRMASKAMKLNSKVQDAIGKLIKSEGEHQKQIELAMLMEVSGGESKQIIENQLSPIDNLIDMYSEEIFLYSAEIKTMFKNVCFYQVLVALKEAYQRVQTYCEEHTEMYLLVADEIFSGMIDKLELSGEQLASFQGLVNGEVENQSLSPVYIHLVPSIASNRTFRSHCLSPNQPAIINCAKCPWRTECDQSHCNNKEFENSIAYIGCTLACMDNLMSRKMQHNADCTQRIDGKFSYSPSSPGVTMSCSHPSLGKFEQVRVCPLHIKDGSCLVTNSSGQNVLTIMVDNEKREISIWCLMAYLYRMATCKGDCNRALKQDEEDMINNSIRNSQVPTSVKVGNYYINKKAFPPRVAKKIEFLLEDYGVLSFNQEQEVENQSNEDLMIKISDMIDAKLRDFSDRIRAESKKIKSEIYNQVDKQWQESVEIGRKKSVSTLEQEIVSLLGKETKPEDTAAMSKRVAELIGKLLEDLRNIQVVNQVEVQDDDIWNAVNGMLATKHITIGKFKLDREIEIDLLDCLTNGDIDPVKVKEHPKFSILKDKLMEAYRENSMGFTHCPTRRKTNKEQSFLDKR